MGKLLNFWKAILEGCLNLDCEALHRIRLSFFLDFIESEIQKKQNPQPNPIQIFCVFKFIIFNKIAANNATQHTVNKEFMPEL